MPDKPTEEEAHYAAMEDAEIAAALGDDPVLSSGPPPFDRPEVAEGMLAAYSCEHGQSNVPCLCHYAVAMLTGDPMPAVMPDNWHETVDSAGGAGGAGGPSDAASFR